MKSLKYICLLLFMVSSLAFTNADTAVQELRLQNNQAFGYGEKLEYRVHYGWINAAKIVFTVGDKPIKVKGRTTFDLRAYGTTNKSFDWAYRVRDYFQSFIDSQSMAPLKYFKSVEEDEYKDVDLVYYDHEKKWLTGKKKSMDMPAYVQDVVSAIFYARTLDFSKAYIGQTFPLDIYLDQTIYTLKFKYLGVETINTDVGKVTCLKLRPQLVVDRVFKDEDDMTIWVSNDANKIPVRVQTDIMIGSLKVDLSSYSGLKNKFSALR
jgi:hypothetical protein